jgi:Tectonin domain
MSLSATWLQLPGAGTDVGVGADGSLWVIGTNGTTGGFGIFRWNGTSWDQVDGGGVRIAVDPNGAPWVVNNRNQIFQMVGGTWELRPGAGTDIGVGADGSVWVIGTNGTTGGFGIFRWNGTSWDQVDGGGVNISVDEGGPALVTNDRNHIFELTSLQPPPTPSPGTLPPLVVDVKLTTLDRTFFVDPDQRPLYLWVIYFKIDGDSVVLGADLHLHGNATIVDRPGDHGDVNDPAFAGQVAIPAAIGEFHTTVQAIPVDPSVAAVAGMAIPGVVGCVALVLQHWDTPDDAVAAGHAALNSSFQQQLDGFLPTLGIGHTTVTPDDVQTLQAALQTSVVNAITNTLSLGDQLLTWLGFEEQDVMVVNASTPSQGMAYTAPPTGPAFIVGQDTLLAASSHSIPLKAVIHEDVTGPIGRGGFPAHVVSTLTLTGQATARVESI